MTTILVIGGGITGLSTIYELNKLIENHQLKDVNLILAEGSDRLGGKIRTVKEQGFIMETGADSMVSRKVMELEILSELKLDQRLVYNSSGTSYLYRDSELVQIPKDTVFGIPVSIESLANTPLISAEGKVEALKDLYLNDNPFTPQDSIGDFLEYYFGKELVEKQIAPVLSGVYSGKLKNLTISSTLPYLMEYKNQYGSLIKGFQANREKFLKSDNKKFISFQDGLSTIAEELAKASTNAEILLESNVIRIEKEEPHYTAYFEHGEILSADYIVLSIPHTQSQELLSDAQLTRDFSELKNSTLYSVYAGFDIPDSVLPRDGTGFIVATNDELYCNACTWTSRKWKHTSDSGNLLIRLFYKSSHPRYAEIEDLSDEKLREVALSDIRKSLQIESDPTVFQVTKWENQMPTYQLNHPQTIASLEGTISEKYPQVYLSGSSYYGVGIPDCIINGQEMAKKIINNLLKG